jgi:hypothetical protein
MVATDNSADVPCSSACGDDASREPAARHLSAEVRILGNGAFWPGRVASTGVLRWYLAVTPIRKNSASYQQEQKWLYGRCVALLAQP